MNPQLFGYGRFIRDVLCLLVAFFVYSPSYAAPKNNKNCFKSLLEGFLNSEPQTLLSFRTSYGEIELAEKIDSGNSADVHQIKSLPSPLEKKLEMRADDLVVKSPYRYEYYGELFNFSVRQLMLLDHDLRREFMVTRKIETKEEQIRMDQSGLAPYWAKGSLPAAMLYMKLDSTRGPLLIKQKVKGLGNQELRDRLQRFGVEKNYIESLRQIYEFVQAVYRVTNIALDAHAFNLVWVEDIGELKKLGFYKPGFALYELDRSPYFSKQFIDVSNAKELVESPNPMDYQLFDNWKTFDQYCDLVFGEKWRKYPNR